jgi:hypothetical protein
MIDIVSTACLVGFAGDFSLQVATQKLGMGGPTGWGLLEYFDQHGSAESLFIAGGMMTIFYVIFIQLGYQLNYKNLAIYGIILDFIFRKLVIFPSLKGYYESLNYFWSAFWGAVPLMMPLFVLKFLNPE